MRNLLSAGFVRLWKCKIFWISCAFMAILPSITILNWHYENITYNIYQRLDSCFFYFLAFIGILSAAVCAMLIGAEHRDGGIRNRLIAGHTRAKIYLANLIICSAASCMMCTAAVAPGLCLGLPLLNGFAMGMTKATFYIAGVYVMSLAYAALFTLLAIFVTGRAASAVSAILLSLVLLLSGLYISGRLDAQPTVDGYTINIEGVITHTEQEPNPAYLPDGPKRQVFQFLYDFFPGGQSVQYGSLRAERPELLTAYDAVVFILTTGTGMVLFRRKDLK